MLRAWHVDCVRFGQLGFAYAVCGHILALWMQFVVLLKSGGPIRWATVSNHLLVNNK